jgi:hypothetical protein
MSKLKVISLLAILAFAGFAGPIRAQVPVYKITPLESKIKFNVQASVAIEGTFEKWESTLTFT